MEICEPFLAEKLVDKLFSGKKYRLGAGKDCAQVGNWLKGTREEVMAPEGEFAGLCRASGKPIVLQIEPVESEVVGKDDTAGEESSG